MIALPFNDHTCLGSITEVVAELVATRTHEEPTAHATARKALRGLVVLLCAAMIVFSLYETMIR